MKLQYALPVKNITAGGFIADRQKMVRDVMIPYQYRVLNDDIPGVEKSSVVKNFENAAKSLRGVPSDPFYGWVFQDSDAGKWIEASAYTLATHPDPVLEEKVDTLIDKIAAAQDTDGYLNTAFTIQNRDRRWTNLQEAHELYTSGHLIEAACAYYEATGKDKLLNVMVRNAEHIYNVFLENGHEGHPGHPEVELALLKLYRITKNEHFFALAKHFIDVRGTDPAYYAKEQQKRNWTVWGSDTRNVQYTQSHCPVRKMDKAVGHAVRACYLYTAMADLAGLTDDPELLTACRRLWQNITEQQMYITGGVGSTAVGEAFTVDYDLPNDSVYAETCASIALIFFSARMRETEPDGVYSDVIEQAFYNTVLAGVQLDGQRYFYVNPLEVVPGITEKRYFHVKAERPGWYSCACCPPNAARMIASYHQYAYGENETTAFCHLYLSGTAKFRNGIKLTCETAYPYGFDVKYTVEGCGRLAIRIPAWSKDTKLYRNEKESAYTSERGYVYLNVSDGEIIRLALDGIPRFITANAKVPALTGAVAVCRGPLVYCFEGVDNDGDVLSLFVKYHGTVVVEPADDLPAPILKLKVEAFRMREQNTLYSDAEPEFIPCTATAVPYYAWANRGANQMRVWMNRLGL